MENRRWLSRYIGLVDFPKELGDPDFYVEPSYLLTALLVYNPHTIELTHWMCIVSDF